MSNFFGNASIEALIQDSIFGLVRAKTGIKSMTQVKQLEYFATFKKVNGIVKISSIFIKKKILPSFSRITQEEIKFSGATKKEFLTFLKDTGAGAISNKGKVLERI
mgnify:FL=1|tara:strand:- start:1033 stop:1350 length:318 start_codon:yes stop_codon:yes gene_type:complete